MDYMMYYYLYVLCYKGNISASSAWVLIVPLLSSILSLETYHDIISYTKLNRLVVAVSFRLYDVNRLLCL